MTKKRKRDRAEIVDQVAAPAIVRGSREWESLTGALSGSLGALDERSAETISAIVACRNLIAGTVSTLPFNLYARTPDGRRDKIDNDPLWWTLNEEWSPRWSAAIGWETLVGARLLNGDGFAEILRSPTGAVRGLRPLRPADVAVGLDMARDELVYVVYDAPGEPRSDRGYRTVLHADMIHVPSAGYDGFRSPSTLRAALSMVGAVAKAVQDFSAAFFRNGARPDFVLKTDRTLTAEQIDNLREQLNERHGGTANAHRPMLLSSGLDVKAIGLPLEDLQLIAVRQFQVEEIARAFGIPPFMIGHTEKTTSWGSGVEAMGAGFVRYTLGRHLKAIAVEFNRKLFPRTYGRFLEFDTFQLERADMRTLFEAWRIALGRAGEAPILTADEIRAQLNMPPIPAGSPQPQLEATDNAPAPATARA